MRTMKSLAFQLSVALSVVAFGAAPVKIFAAESDKAEAQLEVLTKKIDEQNNKIDALSQQLLKLEQQLANIRPGVMIGETSPAPAAGATSGSPVAAPVSGNAHVVTKGETLTSIAKANKVNVQELQKFNHIENDRALQIGQTIMIPTASSPSPTGSPTPPAPPNE
jgi:LysM repeat protein